MEDKGLINWGPLTFTMKVEIIKSDTRLNGNFVEVGEIVEIDENLFKTWQSKGIAQIPSMEITSDKQSETGGVTQDNLDDLKDKMKHVGGGYYELPNGEKVKGKEAAIEALKVLEGGNGNGTQTDNGTGSGSGNS
jgi:hypothetical protein